MPETNRWNHFFTAFRQELYGNSRWRDFLSKFKQSFADHKDDTFTLQPIPRITVTGFQSFIPPFKKAIREHYRFGYGINVWDIAGVRHDEMRNSAILSWLLDCNGSHGQGNLFLEGLLDWLSQCKDVKNVPFQARKFLPQPGSTQNCYCWSRVESLPLGDMESRIDIEIGGPFVLFIEVKVNSQENGDQLKRYVAAARKKAGNSKWGVLFLTKKGSPPEDASLRDIVCRMSWKQMASVLNEVIDIQASKETSKVSFIEHQIKQLCCHIKSL